MYIYIYIYIYMDENVSYIFIYNSIKYSLTKYLKK